MNSRLLRLFYPFFGIILFLSSCLENGNEGKLPLATFFRNADQIGLKISPDGKFVAFLKSTQGKMNLWVRDLSSGSLTPITHDTSGEIGPYKWGNNDKIFFLKDENKNENYHLYLVDKKGGEEKDLTPFDHVRVSWWEDDRTGFNKLFFTMNKRNPAFEDIYAYNLASGQMDMVLLNPGQTQYLGIKKDNAGVLRVIIASNGLNQTFLYREKDKTEFKKILETDFKDRISPISFDEQNKFLYANSNVGRDRYVIVKINPATGKEVEMVYENPQFDVGEFYYSSIRKKPIYASFIDWKSRMVVFDSSASNSMAILQSKFPKLEIRVVDRDSTETNYILRIFNDRNWGYYYLYNRNDKKLEKLANLGPWVKEEAMCPMKPIQFKSRDGLLLSGYLTLPMGDRGKNLPMIVNVHSGPFSRNVWFFDRETQFFANRGYAVLQINYRGSSGYGKEFYKSGFKQWGKKIQDDITDGTRWAIREGIADSARIGLYGIGFGGYCALMGAIEQPNLYACVVSYSGISNVFDYLKDVPLRYKVIANRLNETIGDPKTDFNYIRQVSPVFQVKQFKVPVFIAQGGKDNRVNANDTEYFVKELRRNGVNVTYFLKPNEGGFFTKEQDKLEYYSQLERFLSQNLKKK